MNYGAISGYATKEEALAAWANIVGNEKLSVYEVRIGLASFNPAATPAAWIIIPSLEFANDGRVRSL